MAKFSGQWKVLAKAERQKSVDLAAALAVVPGRMKYQAAAGSEQVSAPFNTSALWQRNPFMLARHAPHFLRRPCGFGLFDAFLARRDKIPPHMAVPIQR